MFSGSSFWNVWIYCCVCVLWYWMEYFGGFGQIQSDKISSLLMVSGIFRNLCFFLNNFLNFLDHTLITVKPSWQLTNCVDHKQKNNAWKCADVTQLVFPGCTVVVGTYRGEQVHRVVQDHQFGTRLHAIDGTMQEWRSAIHLHLPSHMVHLLTDLKEEKTLVINVIGGRSTTKDETRPLFKFLTWGTVAWHNNLNSKKGPRSLSQLSSVNGVCSVFKILIKAVICGWSSRKSR